MKVRHGFVSNSSSSSFVIIVAKTDWDRLYNQLHPFAKCHVDFLGSYGTFETAKFNGMEVIMYGYPSGNASPYEFESPSYDGDDEGIDGYEAAEEFVDNLKKCEHIESHMDF